MADKNQVYVSCRTHVIICNSPCTGFDVTASALGSPRSLSTIFYLITINQHSHLRLINVAAAYHQASKHIMFGCSEFEIKGVPGYLPLGLEIAKRAADPTATRVAGINRNSVYSFVYDSHNFRVVNRHICSHCRSGSSPTEIFMFIVYK